MHKNLDIEIENKEAQTSTQVSVINSVPNLRTNPNAAGGYAVSISTTKLRLPRHVRAKHPISSVEVAAPKLRQLIDALVEAEAVITKNSAAHKALQASIMTAIEIKQTASGRWSKIKMMNDYQSLTLTSKTDGITCSITPTGDGYTTILMQMDGSSSGRHVLFDVNVVTNEINKAYHSLLEVQTKMDIISLFCSKTIHERRSRHN